MSKYGKEPFRSSHPQGSVPYLLERGTFESVTTAKQRTEKILKCMWGVYAEFARQRNEINDQLIRALSQSCVSHYEFKQWQRAVKYKYGLHPLSTRGSLVYIGGRFNTGEDVNSQVPVFSALYLAQDKDTALQEHLGQSSSKKSVLTPRELALANPASETIVSVSGQLDRVVDLTTSKNLKSFVELIKNFNCPEHLKQQAKELKIPDAYTNPIKTPGLLRTSFLIPHWRLNPAQYDTPANSQIFGHLVYFAGIEGILYPSKFTQKPCLALFPKNFANTESFVQFDDEPPHPDVPIRLDGNNWRISELNFEELQGKGVIH